MIQLHQLNSWWFRIRYFSSGKQTNKIGIVCKTHSLLRAKNNRFFFMVSVKWVMTAESKRINFERGSISFFKNPTESFHMIWQETQMRV